MGGDLQTAFSVPSSCHSNNCEEIVSSQPPSPSTPSPPAIVGSVPCGAASAEQSGDDISRSVELPPRPPAPPAPPAPPPVMLSPPSGRQLLSCADSAGAAAAAAVVAVPGGVRTTTEPARLTMDGVQRPEGDDAPPAKRPSEAAAGEAPKVGVRAVAVLVLPAAERGTGAGHARGPPPPRAELLPVDEAHADAGPVATP